MSNTRSMSRNPFLKAKLRAGGALHKIVWRPDGQFIPRGSQRLPHPKKGEQVELVPGVRAQDARGNVVEITKARKVKVERAFVVNHIKIPAWELQEWLRNKDPRLSEVRISSKGEFFFPGRAEITYHGHKGRLVVCLAA